MKLVYFGTAPFAVPALERLAPCVSLVVTQPDRPSGRGMKLQPSPVKAKALELGLRVETPEKCREAGFLELLRAEDADVFVVAAYGQIVPQALLDIPKHGCVNLHGSVLPRWRGAAPIQRAIEAGDTETGVTLMQMDAGMDTGDIIATERTSIGKHELAGAVYERLADMAAEMAESWLPVIAQGKHPRVPQQNELASHAPKVKKVDAELRSTLTLNEAYDKFRAFSPVPGAWLSAPIGAIKILACRPVPGVIGAAGEVLMTKPNLVVGFTTGALNLIEVQPQGRGRMSGVDFANGARLQVGDRLME